MRNVQIMGVLNVTPDSFSDGGEHIDPEAALDHAHHLIADGAQYIDVGAESTRPGASVVSADEEWRRLEPILGRLAPLAGAQVKLSVDTRHEQTMLRALDYRVAMINNVSGLPTLETLEKLGSYSGLEYLCMHASADPRSMQRADVRLHAGNAVPQIWSFFDKAHQQLIAAGFAGDNIWLDPGIGFGKDDGANLSLLMETGAFSQRYQLAIGVSRKSMFGRLLGLQDPKARDPSSKMTEFGMIVAGASLIRTHSVAPLVRMLKMLRVSENLAAAAGMTERA